MTLAADYHQQFRWRAWNLVFESLPLQPGQTLLDLGCAIGDQARELASRGCRVIGLDGNRELIEAAIASQPPNCKVLTCDLRRPPALGITADGIWSSFAPAYFTNLADFLRAWAPTLRPGGWIALTEIDDFFGHQPLTPRTQALLQGFVAEALAAGRYDYNMGRKLSDFLSQSGFTVSQQLTLPDHEFSFQGPAIPEVVDAWRRRFERMPGLQAFCASEFAAVQQDFLACLSHPDHISTARVITCIATKTA